MPQQIGKKVGWGGNVTDLGIPRGRSMNSEENPVFMAILD